MRRSACCNHGKWSMNWLSTDVADLLGIRHTEMDYTDLVTMLDELIDTVGENEAHPLASLMETIGALIESYEDRTLPESEGDPLTTLRLLMMEHNMNASDLPKVGTEQDVHQILSGTIRLTPDQIRQLAERFHVSPATFL